MSKYPEPADIDIKQMVDDGAAYQKIIENVSTYVAKLAIHRTGGNQTKAAESVQMNRQTLRKYGCNSTFVRY